MADPVAINDAGDVMVFSSGEWRQADVAQNARGERVYLSGNSWLPVPARERGVGEQTVRAASQVGAGFNRSLANTLGALPDAVGWGMRQLGIPNAPAPGFYRDTVQRGINAMVGEPPRIENTLERAAYGAGQGLGDAAAVAIPATAISNAARAGSMTANVAGALSAQPALQAASGAVGGAVGEATDSPLLGTAAALAVPAVSTALSRAVSPVRPSLTAAEQAQAALLQREGVQLRPAQESGSPALRTVDSVLESLPMTAGRAVEQRNTQVGQFNHAVLGRAGIGGDVATPAVLANAHIRIGQTVGDIANRTTGQVTPQIATDLRDLATEVARYSTADNRRILGNRITDFLGKVNPQSGEVEGRAIRELDTAIGQAIRGAGNNGDLRNYLRDLQTVLRDTLNAGATAADVAALAQARRDYRNLMLIEDALGSAGAGAARGDISPRALRAAEVNAQGRRGVARGQGDLTDLARAGETFIADRVPNSGTAQRSFWQNMLTGGGIGGAATMAGASPGTALASGAASIAGPMLAQRLLETGYFRPRAAPLGGLLDVDPGAVAGILGARSRAALEGR